METGGEQINKRLSVLFLLCSLSLVAGVAAQDHPPEVRQLTPGKIIEREIAGGQTQSFLVSLLPPFRAAHDRGGEATTLDYLGRIQDDEGNKTKALEFLNEALALFRVTGDRRGEAMVLNNLGLVYGSIGQSQQALKLYAQALPLRRM